MNRKAPLFNELFKRFHASFSVEFLFAGMLLQKGQQAIIVILFLKRNFIG
jgi:hypothetical protein